MGTSIAVQTETRDALERLKRELGVRSIDAALHALLARKATPPMAGERLLKVAQKRKELIAFAKRNGIRSMRIYGSTVHGDAGPNSDLDLLVEFQQGRIPGFIRLAGLENELSSMLGVKVDLQTPGGFRDTLRKEILAYAFPIYDAS